MSEFKYGKFEIEIDPTDVVFIERYEAAADKYDQEISNVKKDGKASDILRAMCEVFFGFFDNLFGENTHEKMFGDKLSVEQCMKALKCLVELMNDYTAVTDSVIDVVPTNRTQRRAKK